MAIFQPTNIIPSSFTQGTVDAVKDNMEISWQVNGNSAMTAFQIDFYLNDTASTPVYSTGKLPKSGETQEKYNLPFYGTDRFGRPQFFTYNAQRTWEEVGGFTNGNNYKFKITQWYEGASSVAKCQTQFGLFVGDTYYFKIPNSTATVYFNVSANVSIGIKNIYYSYTTGNIWIDDGSRIVPCSGGYSESGTIPSGAEDADGEVTTESLNELFLFQTSSNTFITRDIPTLSIQVSDNENFTNPVELGDTLATSLGYFQAKYVQEQDDPIRWVRWQVATANSGVVGDILADTGDVYTPTLNFEFNGFFNGNQYAIRCFGESESGQSCDTDWKFFNINFVANAYDGNFTVQCLHKENATLLEWEGVTVIPPTVSPEDYKPTVSNSSVTLLQKNGDAEYSISWDKVGADPMVFDAPWTAVWKGKVSAPITANLIETLLVASTSQLTLFSPDGKLLVTGGQNSVRLYSVDGTTITYIDNIKLNNADITSGYGSFSPDGKMLLLSNQSTIAIFSVNGTTVSYLKNLSYGSPGDISSVSARWQFAPDGNHLYIINQGLAGEDGGGYELDIFSVADTNFAYVFGASIALGTEYTGDFVINHGGNLLVRLTPSAAEVYTVNGSVVAFAYNIERNGSKLRYARAAQFSPDDSLFALGGEFNGFASMYSVSGSNITYLYDLNRNEKPLSYCLSLAFNKDGDYLVVGCAGLVSLYSITSDKTTNYLFDITKNGEPFDGAVWVSEFSPVSNLLILGKFTTGSTQLTSHFVQQEILPQGKLFSLTDKDNNEITINRQDNPFAVKLNDTQLASITVPDNSTSVAMVITPTTLNAYFYGDNGLISQSSTPTIYTQQPITSVSIYGGDSGATVESVSIYNNKENPFNISLYANPDFEPVWNSNDYQLYMTANFNGNLEGGTGTASGTGFRVYRQEVGKSVLTPIATVSSTTTSLKDYGISSRKAYKYSLYAYDSNSAFMGGVEADNIIATCFKNYSLLVCDYDYDKDEYHVRKQYLFALNLTSGSVGNNNSPTLNANFTQYPTRMPSTQNYASGTLSGLIGAIYTVPALIEQIGQYRYTAKPSTLDYFDSVDLEKELYDLSVAPYQLFLRDMKGRLRMIATNGAISMTTNIKQNQQSISISFPWVEIGDASDVTIIQTPDNYGWNNDNQVLDVQLDVDVATGELSATYPFPYNGTKFYLTGVNKENLTAKTPLGVTPAQFNLSETATQTTDGEVTATVTVNSETNPNNN